MVMSDEAADFFYIMRSWGTMRKLKKKFINGNGFMLVTRFLPWLHTPLLIHTPVMFHTHFHHFM